MLLFLGRSVTEEKISSKLRKQELKIKLLKKTIRDLKVKLKSERSRSTQKSTESNSVSSSFSNQQLCKLRGAQPRWRSEDIVKALAVRGISLKAYETCQKVWQTPLPGVSTIRAWMRNFSCPPGVMTDSLQIMKQVVRRKENYYKLCVLMFDEMALDARTCRDPTFDLVASYSKAQV
jgi:hypothetical protein